MITTDESDPCVTWSGLESFNPTNSTSRIGSETFLRRFLRWLAKRIRLQSFFVLRAVWTGEQSVLLMTGLRQEMSHRKQTNARLALQIQFSSIIFC